MLLAQNLDSIQAAGLPGNSIPNQIGPLLNSVFTYISYGAGIALLIYLVMGGFQLMTSRGEPKAIQSAQAKITNALIGFIVLSFATAIVTILGRVFGIQIFVDIFG